MRAIKVILSFILTGLILLSVGCNPSLPDEFAGKKVINFSVYDGGYGTEYAYNLARQFNANRTDNYAIKIIPEKRNGQDICSEINTGNANAHGYILSGLDIMSGIYQNNLEDLSDVVQMKVDGDEKTIESKIQRKEDWYEVFKVNNKLYALPYTDTIAGLVIDHELFIEKAWYSFATLSKDGADLTSQGITYSQSGERLVFVSSTGETNYTQGDFILSKGKDGKYGTYDDGQPVTEAEWQTMLKKIAITASPFIWGNMVETYVNLIFAALVAQYSGIDVFNTIFTFDSNGEEVLLYDGTKLVFDIKNGYRVNEIKGIYRALEFMDNYMNSKTVNYLHSACTDGGKDHNDAQNLFLLGYTNDRLNKLSAMLVEGAWWEKEASEMFNSLSKTSPDRGYGKRDYRFMLLPDLEGQASDKSVFMAGDTGCIFLRKDSDAERLAVSKEFIAYLLKDSSMREFTRTTGSTLAYVYTLTNEDRNSMTIFANNVYDLYNDSDNITIVRPLLIENKSPICFATNKKGFYYSMLPKIENAFISTQTQALRQYGFDATFSGIKNAYSLSDWNKFIQDAKEQGFYAGL